MPQVDSMLYWLLSACCEFYAGYPSWQKPFFWAWDRGGTIQSTKTSDLSVRGKKICQIIVCVIKLNYQLTKPENSIAVFNFCAAFVSLSASRVILWRPTSNQIDQGHFSGAFVLWQKQKLKNVFWFSNSAGLNSHSFKNEHCSARWQWVFLLHSWMLE